MKKFFTFFAALLFAGGMMADSYVKVTSAPADWSGDYLIVYETNNVAFNGGLETLDAVENTIAVTIADGAIEANATTDAAKFTIAAMEGGYSIQAASGKFIAQNSYANGLKSLDAAVAHSLAIDADGNAELAVSVDNSGTPANVTLRFNDASNQLRFRYYKSGQKAIQLYKREGGSVTPPEPETIPTAAPATPAKDEADVMAIYCNHYTTNNANFGISGWAGAYQTLDLSGTTVGYWTGMTWECIIDPVNTDAAHDYSAYEYVHIDMWAPQAAKIKFTAEGVAGSNYKDGNVVNLNQGWNSFDFAISEWPGNYDFANLKCFVLEQYQTPESVSFEGNPFAFANLYFWKNPATPVLTDPTNCAEAAAAALSVENNNDLYNNGAVYSITGYVTSIQTAYSDQHHNISFWMADAADGGNVIQAYRAACASADEAPIVGDKVTVTGSLTKYNTTPEFAAACTYVIIEHGTPVVPQNLGEKTIAEFLALANTVDTCVLTGIVDNITNTVYGNFDLVEIDNAEVKVYIYGLLTAEGANKQFESLNVAAGDTLTLKAVYSLYNNAPQVKNAVFVAVKKAAVVSQNIEITISSLTTPGALMWTDYVEEEGWWQIYGGNENYQFSISNVSTTETPGVYTIADLDADYTYVTVMTATDTTDVAFVDGSVTVAIDADGIVTVIGALVGEDGITYNFNLTYKDPVAENTVNIVIPTWDLMDTYVESYGLFVVSGEAADGAYVQFSLWMPDDATTIYGDYTEEDFDQRNFGCGLIDATGVQPSIFSATIHIAEVGEAVAVTADILCYNNTLYKVTTLAEGIDNVDAAVKAIKSIINGQLIIEKNNVRYNANGAVVR